MLTFIDSHAHLTDDSFDADRVAVIDRIFSGPVQQFIEIGCEELEWRPALQLAEDYPGRVYAALGIHPIEAHSRTEANLSVLDQLLNEKNAVAIGEVGLDYTYLDRSDRETQHHVFSQMLGLTKQHNKPVVLHIRDAAGQYDAYEEVYRALRREWSPSNSTRHPGVLHCFSARYPEAVQALDLGLLLGINGIFSYKKNEELRETIRKVGIEKIILETDCPYLSPQNKRGQRNDPGNITDIAVYIADYLNVPVEKLAEITTRNSRDLYGLA